MLYLNESHLREIGIAWSDLADVIEEAVRGLADKDFHQPIKPYLRFGDPSNRIIAMPAYLGGKCNGAGIKWIASFPKNIDRGIQRAHSNTILNDTASGKPIAFFNSAYISSIRTASVSGMITRWYMRQRNLEKIRVGMTGFGPIGRAHAQMIDALYGDRISSFRVFDLREIDTSEAETSFPIEVVSSWQEAYADTDVFMTCTVSKAPYIDQISKPGALLNNVSLRDFKSVIMDSVKWMLVDDWDEVCREKTDIESMHLERGLQREDTYAMADLVNKGITLSDDETVMFNPMGMAVFDIAVAQYFYRTARDRGIGIDLPE